MYHILYWRPRRVDQDHSAPNILLRYIRTNHHLYIVIASSISIMVALKSQAIFDISFFIFSRLEM